MILKRFIVLFAIFITIATQHSVSGECQKEYHLDINHDCNIGLKDAIAILKLTAGITPDVKNVSIESKHSTIEALDVSSTQIIVKVRDVFCNPMKDIKVNFSTSAGNIIQYSNTNDQGIATAMLYGENSFNDINAEVRVNVDNKFYSNVLDILFVATHKLISGKVFDTCGCPIANASIFNFFDDKNDKRTDSNGYYELWLPPGEHTVIINHPDYLESYHKFDILEEDKQLQNVRLLIMANVAPMGHLFSNERVFISNIIESRGSATLEVPIQDPITATVNKQKTTNAIISLEYLKNEEIFPVPLPNTYNYNSSIFTDGQTQSAVVSLKPGTLVLNKPAKLTIPNPDSITNTNNHILHYLPDLNKWEEVKALDGTANSQSLLITEGGIYGIFFEDESQNKVKTVHGYIENPNSFIFIADKFVKSDANGYFKTIVCQKKNLNSYIYDSVTHSISYLLINSDNDIDEFVDAFVSSMSLSTDSNEILADGESSLVIKVMLKNHDNIPIVGIKVFFQTTDGTIQNMAKTNWDGVASATLVSSNKANDEVVVMAKCSTIEKTINIIFVTP